MQYLALLLEIIILAFGIYIYLFAAGKLQVKDPELNKKAETFRKENASWMRILALLLIALMSVEVFLNIRTLF